MSSNNNVNADEKEISYMIDYCDQESIAGLMKCRRCRLAPYAHTFSTFVKARWLGRKVLDVLSSKIYEYIELFKKNVNMIFNSYVQLSSAHILLTIGCRQFSMGLSE